MTRSSCKPQQKQKARKAFPMLNPNPIIEANFQGHLLFATPAVEKIFPTLKKLGSKHPLFSDWEKTVAPLRAEGAANLNIERQVGEHWFLEKIFRVPDTNRVRIYFIPIDELKKTQQQLERERNLLQAIMDGARNVHLVYLDRDFNFVHVNETYAKTCGYSPQEMVGKNHFDLYPNTENQALFEKARDTGTPMEVKDKPFVFPDQPKRGITYWDWTIQPVFDSNGKVEGLVFSLVETTERKKILNMLEENTQLLEGFASQMETLANERAKQLGQAERMAAIGHTAAMVGHDIRNPLQAIAGELFLAKEEADVISDNGTRKSLQECFAGIEQNLFYIDKIVADLQDYTRPLKPNRELICAEAVIEEALLIVAIPSSLQVDISTKHCKPFRADLSMLKRVLINLIQNAVQAMPNGGSLKINAHCNRTHVYISVQDSGEGIPPEVQDHLFTPLFTTKSKGQGFGLAVVKRLVEAQDGMISFESRKGQGTIFTVKLPLK
jgi:PAS domain S-box-containing protein